MPLREVLQLAGKVKNVRRVYYCGFHNNDPKQLFQSSLGYNQVMETPPWDSAPFVAYRLNGEPISLHARRAGAAWSCRGRTASSRSSGSSASC